LAAAVAVTMMVSSILGRVTADPAALAVWAAVDATWNARDVEGFSRLFAVDARFVFVDRRHSLDGRTDIHRHFSEEFPRIAAPFSHHTRITSSRTLADGIVEVDGEVEIRQAGKEGEPPTRFRLFAVHGIMDRGGEGWQVRSLRVFELQH
jgi:uncharacterized protein (TIGR02246 family)